MIKHLGEGLLPFQDSGFQRYPEFPLPGEPVTLDIRLDGLSAAPVLHWSVDGSPMPDQIGLPLENGRFRFSLGAFDAPCRVEYAFSASDEALGGFAFDVLSFERHAAPRAITAPEGKICLDITPGFCLILSRDGSGLKIETTAEPLDGPTSGATFWALDDDFSLEIGDGVFLWRLKRFSVPVATCLGFDLWRDREGRVVRVKMRGALESRYVLGTGERFDAVNQKGRGTNGRVAEKFTRQGYQTYLPVPFFLTEQGFGWYREGAIPAEFCFGNEFSITQEAEGTPFTVDHILVGGPGKALQKYATLTGAPALPPDWAFGLWISANGWSNEREVRDQLAALKEYGYPAKVMVLEAWSDERTFYRWNDDGSFPDPEALVQDIRAAGLHLVLWQIPIIKHEWKGQPGPFLTEDNREAIEKGYCVRRPDGTPYRIPEYWFHNSLLPDFTNPEAVSWWFGKRKHLLDMGVEGFKTDGGEFLYEKAARLYDGSTGLTARNLYSMQYVGAYHQFMKDGGVDGVTFSRAGYAGAQALPIHWAGDQLSLWSEFQAQLAAGISAGLSGVLFWGFDIGGFAGELPAKELYLRATAMGCFSPVMQWHAEPRSGQFFATHGVAFNNDRSPWNLARRFGDPSILEVSRFFATLRDKLLPYLTQEARLCVESARPMMAHLCLDFPEDPEAWAAEDQYMLGRALLVAPVIEEHAAGRKVYLPEGCWEDFFTGEAYSGGQTVDCPCILMRLPVFERIGADGRDALDAARRYARTREEA